MLVSSRHNFAYYIRDTSSNLGQQTICQCLVLCGFSHSQTVEGWDIISNYATIRSFQILYNSLFTNNSFSWPYLGSNLGQQTSYQFSVLCGSSHSQTVEGWDIISNYATIPSSQIFTIHYSLIILSFDPV